MRSLVFLGASMQFFVASSAYVRYQESSATWDVVTTWFCVLMAIFLTASVFVFSYRSRPLGWLWGLYALVLLAVPFFGIPELLGVTARAEGQTGLLLVCAALVTAGSGVVLLLVDVVRRYREKMIVMQ